MPTNDERREVARRLREKYKERSSQKSQHEELAVNALNYLEDIESCFPPYSDGFIAISDYIEPEPERACHVVSHEPYYGSFGDEEGEEWHLSCGHDVFTLYLGAPNYCDECGAKVISDAD